jgi:hypothetical protein
MIEGSRTEPLERLEPLEPLEPFGSPHPHAILTAMKSVADALRAETQRAVREMPIAARIALALALGDDDLDLFVRTSGLTRDEALATLRAQRARGRTPSAAAGTGR